MSAMILRCFLSACFVFILAGVATIGFAEDSTKPHIVFLIAEREYETEQTLPAFAESHLAEHYRTTFVYANEADRNVFEGVEVVSEADVLFVSVRRRTLPKQQLERIRKHVEQGKPVVGIRTANHAFCLRNKDPEPDYAEWPQWDRDVFGGNYSGHYGNDLPATISRVKHVHSETHLIHVPCDEFVSGGSLYVVSPLKDGATVWMRGRVEGHETEPVAWTLVRGDGGRSFYTSLGHKDDFKQSCFTTMLKNAIAWAASAEKGSLARPVDFD